MLAHRLSSATDSVIYGDGTPVFATGELEVLLFWLPRETLLPCGDPYAFHSAAAEMKTNLPRQQQKSECLAGKTIECVKLWTTPAAPAIQSPQCHQIVL